MQKNADIPYSQELMRKSIHLCSLLIPVLYIPMDKLTALKILVPITVVVFFADILRNFFAPARAFVNKYFGGMLRAHELDEKRFILNGATYVLLAACVAIVAFPKIIAITAFSILIISDMAAALIGRKFGRHGFFDKSLEGTSAFIVSGIIIVAIIGVNSGAPWTFYIAGAIAAIAGGIIEAASIKLRLDDNFSIPLTIGAIMWLADIIFRNIYQLSFVNLLSQV